MPSYQINDLIVNYLAYWNYNAFKNYDKVGAYFVSRLKTDASLFDSISDESISLVDINLFENTSKDDVRAPYWSNALSFFNSLNIQQKDILFSIIRQVEVDTVSNIFGILDGTSTLYDNQEEKFILSVDSGETIISGDLQDIFLEIENES